MGKHRKRTPLGVKSHQNADVDPDARNTTTGAVVDAAVRTDASCGQTQPPQCADGATGKGIAAAVAAHFSAVEIYFQPATEKRRGGCLYPRDIGTLLLWSVPSSVPLVEGPRVFFLKNRSKLRDVLVVYVNGWAHDEMLLGAVNGSSVKNHGEKEGREKISTTDTSRKRHRGEAAGKSATVGDTLERRWSESLGLLMLSPIRQQQCWARLECGVQFAPMIVQEGDRRVERDIFWRGGMSKRTTDRQHPPGGAQQGGGTYEVATEGKNGCDSEIDKPTPNGVGALFSRALAITNGTSKATSTAIDDVLPTPLEALRELSFPAGGGTTLWNDRDLLMKYALSLEKDKATLEALGFAVVVPENEEPSKWDCFDTVEEPEPENSKGSFPKVFALDCEMVLVKNNVSALARVTLVDVRAATIVIDTLVKPDEEVVDYVTRFSGISSEMLEDVNTTLKECQHKLKGYLSNDAFLVGHSLENDLRACKMLPNCHLLDTAHLFPHASGLPCKNSLRYLALKYLKKNIQQGSHDSEVDACTSAELVYLKMKHGPDFGVNARVNVLNLMEEASKARGSEGQQDGSSAEPPFLIELNIFDDACVLSDIVPNNGGKMGGAVNAVPVRHDADAVRKAVRCLQKRRNASGSVGDDASVSYALTWVQLTQTIVPKGTEVHQGEAHSWEELQRERVDETNRHVMQVIQASPHNSLVIVVASSPSNDIRKTNRASEELVTESAAGPTPRGACFAFVKDDNAVGPLPSWLNKEVVETEVGSGVEGVPGEGISTIPACEQQ